MLQIKTPYTKHYKPSTGYGDYIDKVRDRADKHVEGENDFDKRYYEIEVKKDA